MLRAPASQPHTASGQKDSLVRQVFRFLCVGGTAALTDIALFSALLALVGKYESACFVASFILTTIARFFVDKTFTFRNKTTRTFRQFLTYAACCTATLLLGFAVFRLALALGTPPLWSKIVSIPPVTLSGFLLFRYAAFTEKNKQ